MYYYTIIIAVFQYRIGITSELQKLVVAEDEFWAKHNKYSSSLEELNIDTTNPKITIEIVNADETCFEAIGKHSQLEKTISIDCNGLR